MLTSSRRSKIGAACGLLHQEEEGTVGAIATDMKGEYRVETERKKKRLESANFCLCLLWVLALWCSHFETVFEFNTLVWWLFIGMQNLKPLNPAYCVFWPLRLWGVQKTF